MADTPKAGVLTHYYRYATSNVVILLAGLISFPVSAHYLSNSDFGVLGYWDTWGLFLAALLKLGSGDAMMRFYPHTGNQYDHLRYEANFIYLPMLVAVAGWGVVMGGVTIGGIFDYWDNPSATLLSLGGVILSVVASNILWISGTRELSGFNASVNTIWRLLSVGLTVITLTHVVASAEGVLAARFLVGIFIVAGLLMWLRKNTNLELRLIDLAYAGEGIRYGFPLALKEISNIALSLIDRIMLKWLTGDYAVVGIYTIGYSLASYLEQVVMAAIGQALTPVMNRLYISEGAAAVKRLKQKVLGVLVYVCGAILSGLLILGKDFFMLLAGQSKAESFNVFLVMGIYFAIQPVFNVMGTGLLLEKKSKTVFVLTALAALINVALNLITIPRYGIYGAISSTCIAQSLMHFGVYLKCSPSLRGVPELSKVVKCVLCCVACVLAYEKIEQILELDSAMQRIPVGLAAVLVLYILPVICLDKSLRNMLLSRLPNSFTGSRV